MALTVGPKLQGFFEEVLPAIVTTLNERGTPEMTPIWYEYRDGHILFNGDATRRWIHRMEQTGRATFMVVSPKNFWRWVQVSGNVLEVKDDPGGDHINQLAHRYVGRDYSGKRDTRRSVVIEITSVKGADGAPTEKWDVRD